MKIIILGAGRVGATLAERLSREEHDVTLVDKRPELLRALQDRLDIRTVLGYGSYPDVLEEAGAKDAEMLVAVTDSDEVNMMACQVAYSLFSIDKKIARVRSQHYFLHDKLFNNENMPVDLFISPERLVIDYAHNLIRHPGAVQVVDFLDGDVRVAAVSPFYGGALVGRTLGEISKVLPDVEMCIVAMFREGQCLPLGEDVTIEVGDEVFFVALTSQAFEVVQSLRKVDRPYQNIMIAGGGNIGAGLAAVLEKDYQVKVIELDLERCQYLSEFLSSSTVLSGSATDDRLLLGENIEHMDVFCAVTNDDEVNILSCMLAKRLGARQVMPLVSRPAYVDLMQDAKMTITLSPKQATNSSVLAQIRGSNVLNVHSLRRGQSEAMEIVVEDGSPEARWVGQRLSALDVPAGVSVGALKRGDEVFVGPHEMKVELGDRVVLFVSGG